MKDKIQVLDYAKEILQATKTGALVTTKADGKVNTMTIAWGMLGIEWNKNIFTIFVRESRYTKELLDKNLEFTINIPYGDYDKKILGFCGTKSGKDIDKIKEMNLTLEESEVISVPGIKEFPLTLECKVIYKQDQDPKAISDEENERFYPQNVDSTHPGSNKDYHTAYYGEVVNAYIIK